MGGAVCVHLLDRSEQGGIGGLAGGVSSRIAGHALAGAEERHLGGLWMRLDLPVKDVDLGLAVRSVHTHAKLRTEID